MKSKPVKTAITRIAPGEIDLRGHALVEFNPPARNIDKLRK